MKTEKQKISIITASYNYEDYIGEAIESVLAQTYQNWELIIVDDGSSDNSIEVIKKYCKKDGRIKLFTHPNNENRGLPETIKFGLTKCEGDWVAFLESDDIFTPDSIAEKVKIAQKYPDIALIFSDVERFGDEQVIKDGNDFFDMVYSELSKLTFPKDIGPDITHHNIVPTFSVVMVKKADLLECDFISPMTACLNWYLWAQISKNKAYYIDKKLTRWRMHKKSYISTVGEITNSFYFSILKIVSKRKKYLMLKYFKYLRRNILRIRTGENMQVWFMGKQIF